jgi:hypothetical protein
MRIRRTWGAAAALAVLVLSGCAQGGAGDSSATGGTIEVAVAQTCATGSSPDCVEINGEHVRVADGDFETVGLKSVSTADAQSGNAVELELTPDGAAVLTASSTAASKAGDDARLAIKVGDRLVSAVRVMEPSTDDHVTIALPSGVTVQEFTEQVRHS